MFPAWPPQASTSSSGQNVIVLDDSENEMERSYSYKVCNLVFFVFGCHVKVRDRNSGKTKMTALILTMRTMKDVTMDSRRVVVG